MKGRSWVWTLKLLSKSTVETRLPAEKKYISKWHFFFSKEMC